MGKKSKLQKLNVATEMNLDPTPEMIPINGSDHRIVSKKVSNHKSSVRRSGRLQSVVKPVQIQNQVVEQIDLLESEKEEDLHVQNAIENHVEEEEKEEPCNEDSGDQKIRDEQVHHLVKTIEEYKSKGGQGPVSSESTSVGLIYKSLYLDSQKKIEALTLENHDLARKLEIVLAKLEVYENINRSTQAVIVSNLEKAIEALVRPASYFSSSGGDAEAGGGGGGAVAKEESAKKRRHDHVI
ncbi:unnamed protein product [Lactuca virosa]|uniref:Uncharacterized protein n=1 Tax=Lactuca virosa TaxID=75947 RepID=A0AAU9M6N5_9ASTR|nr:unnamed protein product [Lactuca virosa]